MDEFQFLAAAPLALALLTVLVASVVQTSSGIGFGMVAAPILILIDTRLVPGPILLLSLIVSAMAAFRERHDIDYRGLTVALGGRIPGTILAGLTITLIPATTFGLVFGTLVLLAVILSVLARSIPPFHDGNLFRDRGGNIDCNAGLVRALWARRSRRQRDFSATAVPRLLAVKLCCPSPATRARPADYSCTLCRRIDDSDYQILAGA